MLFKKSSESVDSIRYRASCRLRGVVVSQINSAVAYSVYKRIDILQRHREAQELERPSAVIRVPRGRPQRRPRRYCARAPDVAAYCRARRPKPSKLVLVPRLGRSSRTVWRIAGRPSRSRRGYVERIPATSRCGCHTTPSISASSCRPAARPAATRHSAVTGRHR